MCSRSDWLDITQSNTKIKGDGITVSNRIFNNGGSKSLRSKKRIEELLNSYKNSKVKRTFEVRSSTPYMFILHTGVTSSRIHFVNMHESVQHSVTLKRLMTICRKTDMLLTSFSDDFLFIRSINVKSNNFNQTGYNNIQITVRLSKVSAVNNNKICDISESQLKISSKKVSSKVSRKKSSVLNSEIVDLNDSDILVVDQYCGSCGESFGKDRLSLKRKHKCVSDVLEKCLKIEALNEKKTLENSQETEKTLENINTTVHLKNTKEVGLSPIVFPSSPISKSNNNLTPPINSTMLSIAQTSTPVQNHDVACNTSNTSFFSSHNSTNSLIDSPRMKKILEFLDKRYKHKVNAVHNNTVCLNSSKPNLETINEEGDKNNDDETKDKVNNNNNKNHNNNNVNNQVVAINEAGCSAEDCDNFEPQCVDNSNINHIFGDNYYGSKSCLRNGLRLIVIDGSNIAMGHSKGKFFSSEGLRLCIDYFHRRGHQVKAFVPNFRLKYGQSSNPKLLRWLYKRGWVVFTPSREVNGKLIVSYDDRFIVQCAALYNAVIVSNDCYRDLISENPSWKETIENNLLMPTWVDNVIYFPSDPLGRRGPTLQKFLRYS